LVTARVALAGVALASVLLAARPAAAQTALGATSPSVTAPNDDPPPPAILPPPAGAAAPSLEAGDTAAPGAPVQPLLPPAMSSAAPPGALPPTLVQGSLANVPPREPRPKVYETRWFWGAVGVVVITTAIVVLFAVSSANPTTPSTKLGDMRAF
jgi:hypothetical protein